MRHRGPDGRHLRFTITRFSHANACRLLMLTPAPSLYNARKTHVLAVNGEEIYNHPDVTRGVWRSLRVSDRLRLRSYPRAISEGKGPDFLDGIYRGCSPSPCMTEKDAYLIGRDHIGIIPLYMGYDEFGNFYVASEMKALTPICRTIKEGSRRAYRNEQERRSNPVLSARLVRLRCGKDNVTDKNALRRALGRIREKPPDVRHVAHGVCSSGLDSSIISLYRKNSPPVASKIRSAPSWWPQLHSFAVGLEGSPDLKAAGKWRSPRHRAS